MDDKEEWARAWAALLWTFAAAALYTVGSSQLLWLKSFPVLTWLGLPAATRWGWELSPSMGYIGQVEKPSFLALSRKSFVLEMASWS